MLNFAEEILLLALDDEAGALRELPALSLENALVAAVLMDLAFLNRIDNDQNVLRVIDPTPTGDEVLDTILADLGKTREDIPIPDCLEGLFLRSENIRKKTLDRLVQKKVLRVENSRILWVFAVRRYPKCNGVQCREVKSRLRSLILSEALPDPRDAALVGLIDACRLWDAVLTEEETRQSEERIRFLAGLDLIGQATISLTRRLGVLLFTPQPF